MKKKKSFLNVPTPMEYLETLSQELGVSFYIKRDDLTNLAFGGNKLRKLEYIVQDAKEKGATAIVTRGGVQTNHGRLTAAVAAKFGMKCGIVSVGEYPGELSANLLLDRILGAEVFLHTPDHRPIEEQYEDLIARACAFFEKQGEVVYYTPMGGSDEVGTLGYVDCGKELAQQADALGIGSGRVICTVGSLGTYIGLYCGLKQAKSPLKLTGVGILPLGEDKEERLFNLYTKVGKLIELDMEVAPDFHVEADYLREGYNLPSKEVREGIYYMARKEGILLDPCYTGKTFAGILDMIKEGKIEKGETLLFLHTGGGPGLYTRHHREAFEKELLEGVHFLP